MKQIIPMWIGQFVVFRRYLCQDLLCHLQEVSSTPGMLGKDGCAPRHNSKENSHGFTLSVNGNRQFFFLNKTFTASALKEWRRLLLVFPEILCTENKGHRVTTSFKCETNVGVAIVEAGLPLAYRPCWNKTWQLCYLPECTGSKAQTYKSHRRNTEEYTVNAVTTRDLFFFFLSKQAKGNKISFATFYIAV